MTNVYSSPEKLSMKNFLFTTAVESLESDGWRVERIPRSGKSSVRRITRGSVSKVVAIRTSQNTWIAFPHLADGSWRTLEEVDLVVASSVDDEFLPKTVKVHVLDGDDVRARFARAYEARKNAGYQLQPGRGIWISLYDKEGSSPVTHVGAGAGLISPPIAVVPIGDKVELEVDHGDSDDQQLEMAVRGIEPLSISEAKRRLAFTLGVPESAISIVVNG